MDIISAFIRLVFFTSYLCKETTSGLGRAVRSDGQSDSTNNSPDHPPLAELLQPQSLSAAADPQPAVLPAVSPPPPPPPSAASSAAHSLAVRKLCRLPSEAGVCSETIKRYYYSAHSRHCVEFVYGGCNGNENNFDNITECEATCQGVLPCPYVAWVPGCTLQQNGEDSDGCQTYEMTCEPTPTDKGKKSTTAPVTSTTTTTSTSTTTSPATTSVAAKVTSQITKQNIDDARVAATLTKETPVVSESVLDALHANETATSIWPESLNFTGSFINSTSVN